MKTSDKDALDELGVRIHVQSRHSSKNIYANHSGAKDQMVNCGHGEKQGTMYVTK